MATNIVKELEESGIKLSNANLDLWDMEDEAVNKILLAFKEMVTHQLTPITERDTIENAALRSYSVQTRTQEMIQGVETLLCLTRRMRELWVVGPLDVSKVPRLNDWDDGEGNDNRNNKKGAKDNGGPEGTVVAAQATSSTAARTAQQERDADAQAIEDMRECCRLRDELRRRQFAALVAKVGNGEHCVVDTLGEEPTLSLSSPPPMDVEMEDEKSGEGLDEKAIVVDEDTESPAMQQPPQPSQESLLQQMLQEDEFSQQIDLPGGMELI